MAQQLEFLIPAPTILEGDTLPAECKWEKWQGYTYDETSESVIANFKARYGYAPTYVILRGYTWWAGPIVGGEL